MDHSIGLTSLSNHSQLNRTTTIDHQHLQQSHHDSQQQHNDPHSSSKCNNERGQHILNISNQSNNSNISQSNILCSNSETDFRNPNPGGLLLSNHNLAPNSMPVCEIDTSSIQTLMSRNRQQLQVKLLVRRPIAALIEQGILPRKQSRLIESYRK